MALKVRPSPATTDHPSGEYTPLEIRTQGDIQRYTRHGIVYPPLAIQDARIITTTRELHRLCLLAAVERHVIRGEAHDRELVANCKARIGGTRAHLERLVAL